MSEEMPQTVSQSVPDAAAILPVPVRSGEIGTDDSCDSLGSSHDGVTCRAAIGGGGGVPLSDPLRGFSRTGRRKLALLFAIDYDDRWQDEMPSLRNTDLLRPPLNKLEYEVREYRNVDRKTLTQAIEDALSDCGRVAKVRGLRSVIFIYIATHGKRDIDRDAPGFFEETLLALSPRGSWISIDDIVDPAARSEYTEEHLHVVFAFDGCYSGYFDSVSSARSRWFYKSISAQVRASLTMLSASPAESKAYFVPGEYNFFTKALAQWLELDTTEAYRTVEQLLKYRRGLDDDEVRTAYESNDTDSLRRLAEVIRKTGSGELSPATRKKLLQLDSLINDLEKARALSMLSRGRVPSLFCRGDMAYALASAAENKLRMKYSSVQTEYSSSVITTFEDLAKTTSNPSGFPCDEQLEVFAASTAAVVKELRRLINVVAADNLTSRATIRFASITHEDAEEFIAAFVPESAVSRVCDRA
jgi:hypothetical protein